MKRLVSLLLASCLCALAIAVTNTQSVAQDYPNRPIRIVVPFAPGGTTDIVARALSGELKHNLGQSIVIENKPGADGLLAIQELTRSGADGYTFMIGNVGTNAVAPILNASKMSLNYNRDVVPVMRLVDIPGVLVATTKNFSPKAISELIAYAKQNPGVINYGTPGFGNYTYYDMVLFAHRAGLIMTAIPNKAGAMGMINDLLAGTVQICFVNAASAAGNIHAGNLRALAVVNHARLGTFPDVPTMAEAGFPKVGTIAWQGLFADSRTPKEILEKVRKAAAQALQTPSVRQALEQQGFNIVPTNSLDEARAWLTADMKDWKKTIADMKLDASH